MSPTDRPRTWKWPWRHLAWMGVIVVSVPASAATGRVRHEPLPPAKDGGSASGPALVASEDPAALAAAIRSGKGLIGRPSPSQPGDPTPVYAPRATPKVGIDRRTGADGRLHYQSVFDPEIVPFKRELAFDTVRPDVTMAQSGEGQVPLPTGHQEPRAGRELFWGHLRLKIPAGGQVPLPSVAPDSRVLQWEAVPLAALRLLRDRAGNFVVAADQAVDVDLRYVMDAPSTYFAAALGSHAGHGDPEKPALDGALQRRAEALWAPLGLGPRQDRQTQLETLAAWFRSFEPGLPPEAGADPLADLVLGKRGVCRHRSLGFVVLAHSLGIPCHYVMNDAHAFVEVWTPLADGSDAWQRLDLGGGAESLDVHAAENKRMHTPAERDPFPRPPAYGQDSTDVRVDGQPVQHPMAGAKKVNGLDKMAGVTHGPSGAGMGTADPNAKRTGTPNAPSTTEDARRAWLRQHAQEFAAPLTAPEPGATARPTPQDKRAATGLTLHKAGPLAWVGEALEVTGRLTGPAGKLAQLQVELWLIDPRRPLAGQLLGVALTDAGGQFRTRVAVPLDAELASYDLIARYAGSSQLQGSDSSQH